MIENQALLSAIVADPDNDRHRLAYADWLEQHDHFEHARLIRVQIELARLPDSAVGTNMIAGMMPIGLPSESV